MTLQPEKPIISSGKLAGRRVSPPKTEVDELTDATIQLPRLPKETIRLYAVAMEEASAAHSITKEGVSRPLPLPKSTGKQAWFNDSWLLVTMLVSYITSIASFWYFFQHHQIILYGDAYAHMLIIRRVFDNVTPGLAQLGGVWLPLPHLVMLPFIWNNYLWYTGLAGTIPSLICYQIATVYIFLAARRLTHDSRASFIGTLLFILNPNVLYLQTTALSEIVLIATLTAAAYYFLAWAQEDKLNYLILAGFATCLATLSRYDGWFLLATMLILIVPIGLLKRHHRSQIEGNLISFGAIGGLGIVLWLAWCLIIFANPLYFQDGPFSSQAQQKSLIDAHVLFTYHDLWQSLRYYTIDAMQNLGPVLFVCGIVAVVIFIWRRRLTPEMLAGLVYLSPFVFYVVSLYGGQAAIYVPGAVPANFAHQIYNARYGVEVVAPAAVFIATLVSVLPRGLLQRLGHIVFVSIIIVQAVVIALGGIISLQDGQYGLDCAHAHTIILFMAQHYGGGKILEDLYDTKMDALNPEAQIDFKNIIYEGSGSLWKEALHNPASMVNWIIVNPADQSDQVANNLTPTFNAQFTRDIEESSGLSLYHRNGLAYPTRPIPSYLINQQSLCVDAN
jgi:Dolichyl-phosphate-mannose-protein mannosyltransferase